MKLSIGSDVLKKNSNAQTHYTNALKDREVASGKLY